MGVDTPSITPSRFRPLRLPVAPNDNIVSCCLALPFLPPSLNVSLLPRRRWLLSNVTPALAAVDDLLPSVAWCYRRLASVGGLYGAFLVSVQPVDKVQLLLVLRIRRPAP